MKTLPENENEEELSDVEINDNVTNNHRQYHRRKNLYAVRSIDTSLDESSYDLLDIDNEDLQDIELPL